MLEIAPRVATVVNAASIIMGCGMMLAQIGNLEEAALFARASQQVLAGAGLMATAVDLIIVASIPDVFRGLMRTSFLDINRPARIASLTTMVVAMALNGAVGK